MPKYQWIRVVGLEKYHIVETWQPAEVTELLGQTYYRICGKDLPLTEAWVWNMGGGFEIGEYILQKEEIMDTKCCRRHG